MKQPIAFALDDRARLWVAEAYTYPRRAPEGQGKDRILIFEDTDGDGVYDKRTEFATGLSYPNGLMCWRGGLIVTCAPDIFYLKDTDGDGRADVSKVLQTAELRAELESMGAEVINNTPEQFAEQMRTDNQKWGEVIRKANIKGQ